MYADDMFLSMWDDQESFMRLLAAKRNFPSYPLDITKKSNQKFIRGIAFDAVHELHEAISELKNSKDHRATGDLGIDRQAFLEEVVDATKLITEVLIFSGFTPDEFYNAYFKKSAVNEKRIEEGY